MKLRLFKFKFSNSRTLLSRYICASHGTYLTTLIEVWGRSVLMLLSTTFHLKCHGSLSSCLCLLLVQLCHLYFESGHTLGCQFALHSFLGILLLGPLFVWEGGSSGCHCSLRSALAGLRFKVSLKLMFLIKILIQSLGWRVLTLVNQPAQMVITGLVNSVDLEV